MVVVEGLVAGVVGVAVVVGLTIEVSSWFWHPVYVAVSVAVMVSIGLATTLGVVAPRWLNMTIARVIEKAARAAAMSVAGPARAAMLAFADEFGRWVGVQTQLQPIGPRVLVRRQPDADVSTGGLVIPAVARSIGGTKPGRGIVEAVGRRRLKDGSFIDLDVVVGERVIFSRLAGDNVDWDDDLVLLHEDDILFVIDPETRIDALQPTEES